MEISFEYVKEIIHYFSQMLLTPVIVVLLALVVIVLFIIGLFIVEVIIERLHFKPTMPKLIDAFANSSEEKLPDIVKESGLLKRQKEALLTLYDHRDLPEDMVISLSDRLMKEQDDIYQRRIGLTDIIARISPMVGLMGTLIPLGPGIVALGQGQTAELASALMIAFDTTVAGIVIAVVALLISKIRKRWYSNYMNALKNALNSLLCRLDEIAFEKEEAGEYTRRGARVNFEDAHLLSERDNLDASQAAGEGVKA